MKYIYLTLLLIFCTTSYAQEINDHCYKFEGVYVCNIPSSNKNTIIQEVIKEIPKKEISPIVKTYWKYSDKKYSDKQICEAIYIIEGKEKANQEYGINPQYVKCKNRLECEKVCLNTVKNKRKTWNQEGDFLEYLSKKYCPPNHSIWLKNLKIYLRKLN